MVKENLGVCLTIKVPTLIINVCAYMHEITTYLPMGWGLLAAILLILLNGFFVAAEFAMVKVRRTRIQELVNQGHFKAKLVLKITQHLDAYLPATQFGITLASIALGWIGEPAFAKLLLPVMTAFGEYADISAHTLALILAFTFITFLHVIVGELIPKSIAIQHAEQISLWIAYPLWLFDKIFFPILNLLNQTSNFCLNLIGFGRGKEKAPSEEELRLILAECSQQGVVSPAELTIIKRVLTFSDKQIKDIFVPKEKVDTLHVNDPFEIQHQKAGKSLHTQLPVIGDGYAKILGFVRIQDLLFQEAETFALPTILRPILEFLDTFKIDQAFQTMKERKIFIAAVYDKKGIWLGIITITDIIEEIVGQMN